MRIQSVDYQVEIEGVRESISSTIYQISSVFIKQKKILKFLSNQTHRRNHGKVAFVSRLGR